MSETNVLKCNGIITCYYEFGRHESSGSNILYLKVVNLIPEMNEMQTEEECWRQMERIENQKFDFLSYLNI